MSRVVATDQGEWIEAIVEGPRAVRLTLRQSIPPSRIRYDTDRQVWTIHRESWRAALQVFSRFELPVSWHARAEPESADVAAPEPQGEELTGMAAEVAEFTVSIRSAGLTVERAVDSETAWAVLALVLAKENTRPSASAA